MKETKMALMQQFVRWLKDRPGKPDSKLSEICDSRLSKLQLSELRDLPPIPDEYGFHTKKPAEDTNSHIYEEIIYDLPMTNLNDAVDNNSQQETSFITGPMQKLDFSGAKSVGPYLVVPIRKNISKKSDRHNLDLIADLKHSDATKIENYQSLYSMMPDWAKEHLKVTARSRQGLVVSKGYSVDEPPSNRHLRERRNRKSKHEKAREKLKRDSPLQPIPETEPGTFIVHRTSSGDAAQPPDISMTSQSTVTSSPSHAHGNIRLQNPKQTRCNNNSDYQVPLFDHSEDYEYFLVKTQKNLRIEQELRDYLNGTPASMASDDVAAAVANNESETRDVLVITKKDSSKSGSKVKSDKSVEASSDKYQRAADALLDQIYSSLPSPLTDPRTNAQTESRTDNTRPKTMSHSPVNDSRLSCRATDFKLGQVRRRKESNCSLDGSSDGVFHPYEPKRTPETVRYDR